MKYPIIILLSLFGLSLRGQSTFDTTAIKSQLEFIRDRDQKTRKSGDSTAYNDLLDSLNLSAVEVIIAKYGWLSKQVIGERGNQTLFLVIQHADLSIQEKYLPIIKQSIARGESNPIHGAMLEDRILMRQGKKQIYGSQVIFNDKGEPVFYPIEDEKNVNQRRTSIGMETIEEYAKHFGINYQAPQ